MPTATPIVAAEEELAAVAFDADGLVPAIVQEDGTGRVLMLAWMDAEALRRTLDEGRTWFWSRSRKEHWRKGDTSGDRQWVRAAYYDCDMDTLCSSSSRRAAAPATPASTPASFARSGAGQRPASCERPDTR